MTAKRATIIAATYERVSRLTQARDGFSLGAQHRSLEEFAAMQGWELPDDLRFRDGDEENASGADWDLPGLTAMLEAARERRFQVLAVPDLDRFARSLVKGLVLEEHLSKYGVRVVYQRVPVDDTPEGRLLKNQLFSFAEYEREKILLRTMTGKLEKARRGLVVGSGPARYGYRYTYRETRTGLRASGLEPDPASGPVARRILDELLTRSAEDIARGLDADGIPAPGGGRWQSSAVWRIGTDPIYMGLWLYGKNGRRMRPDDPDVTAVPVPALIDRDHWERIQAALERRRSTRRGRHAPGEDPWLLRGMLECGHCHSQLRTQPNSGVLYYRCPNHMPSSARVRGAAVCVLPDVHAKGAEAELWRIVSDALLDPDNLARGMREARAQYEAENAIHADRLAALEREIAAQRKRLDGLAARLVDAGDGELGAALTRQGKEIEALIGRLTRERDELSAARVSGLSQEDMASIEGFAAEMRTGIAHATEAERRQLYERLQIRGVVHSDPDGVLLGRKHRFRIEWRGALPLGDSVAGLSTPGTE